MSDTANPVGDDTSVGTPHWLQVVLDVPLPQAFDYRSDVPVAVGHRVLVPFGRRTVVGVVVACPQTPGIAPDQVKPIWDVLDDLPPLPADWLGLTRFAATYYQRPWGEVILPALPPGLRRASAYQGPRAGGGPVARLQRRLARRGAVPANDTDITEPPVLLPEQQAAVSHVLAQTGFGVTLLHGVTGSGKTEVYLHIMEAVLQRGRQVLLMVPEINLTPQLEAALRARFARVLPADGLAVLHSGLADGARLQAWLAAYSGQARVVLGTRLAILTPLPELGLVIVDEEHDASYKQQDGLRYSARDLAVWRGHDLNVPVLLGSATPSLESWYHAQRGHYHALTLSRRARTLEPPAVRLVDTRRLVLEQGFSPQLLKAIDEALAAKRQALVFLNRRGYAPTLRCVSCGWVSRCTRCSAYTVVHRSARMRAMLQCHHCGYQAPVPRACPDCGDQDLQPMGRGTQRVEDFLAEQFPQARIARIDADSTRARGSAHALFSQVHAGEIDILVGTQMVAKGHDFARLAVVGVLDADAALFAHDFRAPERLLAQLMQVAGRAGRHEGGGDILVQTDYPDQPVYRALLAQDYAQFARHTLAERESLGLPPYSYHALLVAEARELAHALACLTEARDLPVTEPQRHPSASGVVLYDPVPLRVVRVAHVERAQLLVESPSRATLHRFLASWLPEVMTVARQRRVRCHLEVDPAEI